MGRTVGTLLHLMKSQFGTGKTVVLDSGFCVLQGLVELKKNGMYAHAFIKKRRYWPKHVPGDAVMEHFNNKEVGERDAIHGELDGLRFYLYGMKEPDYIMQIMSTYRTLHEKGPEKKRHFTINGEKVVKTFHYAEIIHNHYAYRDMIDNHNSERVHPISMEETWMTTHWPNHVFCFLLAVTVVNVQNAGVYFGGLPKVDALTAQGRSYQGRMHGEYSP